METTNPPEDDIPAHFKYYNIFVLVPRELGKVTLIGGESNVAPARWSYGVLPAASPLHAIKTMWEAAPHVRPALLSAHGNPLRQVRLRRADLRAEEVEKPAEVAP